LPDNIAITAGAGTTVATDEIAGINFQRVKVTWGVDGVANDASATTPLPVQLSPIATDGADTHRRISDASTNAANIKSSAGVVYGILAVNTNAAARFLKLYNITGSPTVGTTTPFLTIPLPGAGGVAFALPQGITFSTGIARAITTGAADTDTGAVAANEIVVHVFFK
jgi:hypothetical protein